MSRTAWIWVAVVVIIVIIGLWYVMRGSGAPAAGTAAAPYGVATDTNVSTLPTGTSTSDASLNTDLQSVDSQMSGFNSDDAAASQSVSQEQQPSAQ